MNGYKKNMLHSPKKIPCTTGQWEKILAQTNSSTPSPPQKSNVPRLTVSNKNVFKSRVEKKKLEQILSKS